MSDTKWTPGPWKPHATGLARSGKPEHEIHWSDDGECVAEIVHGEPEAHLIAAAPDLYDALSQLLPFVDQYLRDTGEFDDSHIAEQLSPSIQALAKARGGTMSERARFEAVLIEFISYDPITGILVWAKKPNRSIRVGTKVGSVNKDGYLRFTIKGRSMFAHRVAWFLFYGRWPKNQIDHINRKPKDNRICNLRDVPQSKNMQNTRLNRKNCSTGYPGVRYRSDRVKCWRTEIKIDGKTVSLGCYETPEEAHQVYLKAKEEMHGYRT